MINFLSLDILIALIFLVLGGASLFLLTLPRRAGSRRIFRVIPAFQRLRRAVGLAVEDGSRLHVSLGKSSLLSVTNATALVGLSTLERITQLSSASDRPPLATSGDGGLATLSQDTLRAAYRFSNASDQYSPDQGRMLGSTPLAYTAGALPVIHDERISAHILVGNFGPEVALLGEAADQEGAFVVAGSDSLPAQAALYATTQEVLIGEEVFAVPAYLQAGPQHQASLQVQDILRWLVIVLLLAAIGLKVAGIL